MTKDDLFLGAGFIVSIKATFEVRGISTLKPIKKIAGELVLTEKEVVFLEVKGLVKKEKKRVHAFPTETFVGYSYESWGRGPVTLSLASRDDAGTLHNYVYTCTKGAYEKLIGKVKERRII